MFVVRWILGRVILLISFIFSPRGIKRSNEEQKAIDEQTKLLTLYQFPACPFCVKVRRQMTRLSLNISLVDAKQETNRNELIAQGGSPKVPCLRIESTNGDVQWMYESSIINTYLTERFNAQEHPCQG
jgi:glutaredoxin